MRASQLNEDPYNVAATSMEQQLKSLRVKFDAFKVKVSSVDTTTVPGFAKMFEDMKQEVRKNCDQCFKLKNIVTSVEQKREQFPHIDDRELESRKNTVERLRVLASRIQAELHSPEVTGKITSDDRRALARNARIAEDTARSQSAHTLGNSAHLASAGTDQKLIVKQQDVVLDKLESGLDTLNDMAQVIQSEVEEQGKVLDDISAKTDEAQNKLDGAMTAVKKLLGANNTGQLCLIGALVIAFIVLAYFAVS